MLLAALGGAAVWWLRRLQARRINNKSALATDTSARATGGTSTDNGHTMATGDGHTLATGDGHAQATGNFEHTTGGSNQATGEFEHATGGSYQATGKFDLAAHERELDAREAALDAR
eukprot:162948_1